MWNGFLYTANGNPSMSNKTKIEKTGECIGKTPKGKSYSICEYTEFLDVTTSERY